MRETDPRYAKDLRKHTLARWMILREARPGTVTQWTGLIPYRIRHLTRLYWPDRDGAHRGNSPTAAGYFTRSSDLESESLAFLFIAIELQVIPLDVLHEPRKVIPNLARGERLRSAFELYRALVPSTRLTLEHAILLIFEFARRRNVWLRRCERCNDVMISEPRALRRRCPFCRSGSRMRLVLPDRVLSRQEQVHECVIEDDAHSASHRET